VPYLSSPGSFCQVCGLGVQIETCRGECSVGAVPEVDVAIDLLERSLVTGGI
jgi:hypothetical protein